MFWLKGKTLHVLYFLDAHDTRKVSFSLNVLKAMAVLVVLGAISGGYAIFSSIEAYQTIEAQKESIKKLKATILAQTIQSENLLSKESLQSQNIYLSPDVTFLAQELLVTPKIKVNEKGEAEANQQTVEMKKLSIGRPSSQEAKSKAETTDKSSAEPVKLTANQSNTSSSAATSASSKAEAVQQPKVTLPKLGDWSLQIKDLKLTQNDSRTEVKFQMINTNPNRRVVGWICVQMNFAQGKAGPSIPKFMSTFKTGYPSFESCKRGQRASFRNLRYVTLELDVAKEPIESISIYFLDAESQKLAVHQSSHKTQ